MRIEDEWRKMRPRELDEGVRSLIMQNVCLLCYFAGLQQRSSHVYILAERGPHCRIAQVLLGVIAKMNYLVPPTYIGISMPPSHARGNVKPRRKRGRSATAAASKTQLA